MPSTISQMRSGQPQKPSQPQLNEAYINQLKMLMHSNNAQEYLAQAAMQNPQFRQILQIARSGGNLSLIFENIARQQGIDPKWLLNKLMN